ncbi:helix-turn-helix domain-containing protein [Mesorhizobium tamadayense]|uniref:helix-turn-helix domain-containing protein n=1 Tax=Mesorhizobium tamadayense TaxID=425306 RepID=UPI00315DFD08
MSRPLVSTGMIQDRLKVTKQGALNLVGELGLREMTGRGRFRAWGLCDYGSWLKGLRTLQNYRT